MKKSFFIDISEAVIVIPPDLSDPEKKAVTMLVEEVEKRAQIQWTTTETWPSITVPVIIVGPVSALNSFAGPYTDELSQDGDTGPAEGYRIRTKKHGETSLIFVIGNDARGVLFGIGHLLRTLRMNRKSIYTETT